jgi:hypothetical protein
MEDEIEINKNGLLWALMITIVIIFCGMSWFSYKMGFNNGYSEGLTTFCGNISVLKNLKTNIYYCGELPANNGVVSNYKFKGLEGMTR